MSRPPLPAKHANPHIRETLNSGALPPVKYQILNCQGQDILVGRLKIETPTPTGHAFILRRFDTNAISLTTMFRAAYPTATESEEKAEVQWVKDNYDLSGNNGSSKENHITRLAGTWISPAVALELGEVYALGEIINAVVAAAPDPKASYRRSGKGQNSNTVSRLPANAIIAPPVIPANISPVKSASAAVSGGSPTKNAATTTASSSPTGPTPAKRRREASPVPSQVSPSKPHSQASSVTSAAATVPTPRRSARTKSPAPRSAASAIPRLSPIPPLPAKTPKKSTKRETAVKEVLTPQGSDDTAVQEDEQDSPGKGREAADREVEAGIAGEELRLQDLEEQKTLIKGLKAAQRSEGSGDAAAKKRTREEEGTGFKFQFKEPEVGDRAIATNRRVGRFTLEPRTKSFAWGIAAFAVGMGAVSFLPNFF